MGWLSSKIVVYLINGNPTLAKMFLNWLAHVDEGGDHNNYNFPSETVQLKHQDVDKGLVRVDSRECMEYLTSKCGPKEILLDPLVSENKELLWFMASAEETVDLFDKSTWGDVEYDDLVEAFHKKVAIHCCNSQRTESFVLASAIISRTNVEEARRRSCRGITQSSVMRPFNEWSKRTKLSRVGPDRD